MPVTCLTRGGLVQLGHALPSTCQPLKLSPWEGAALAGEEAGASIQGSAWGPRHSHTGTATRFRSGLLYSSLTWNRQSPSSWASASP